MFAWYILACATAVILVVTRTTVHAYHDDDTYEPSRVTTTTTNNNTILVLRGNGNPSMPSSSSSSSASSRSLMTTCVTMKTDVIYTIKPRHTGMLLYIDGDSLSNRKDAVQLPAGSASVSFKWRLKASGSKGYYRIINENSGKELRVKSSSHALGAAIAQYPVSPRKNGSWCFIEAGGGYFRIDVEHSGHSIEVEDGNMGSGADLEQAEYNGGWHQQFLFLAESGSGDDVGSLTGTPPSPPPPTPTPPSPPPPTPSTPTPPTSGEGTSRWSGPYDLDHVAAAAANLPNGDILTWSSARKEAYGGGGGGKTFTSIFDPTTKKVVGKTIENTDHDMFCPGTAVLPDQRILITGGQTSRPTTVYDPKTNKWTVGDKLVIRRGYHSMTVLTDGRVFTLGGSFTGGYGDKHGEIWDPKTEQWKELDNVKCRGDLLTDDKDGVYRSDNHMWLFTAPNGWVFHAGPSKRMHWIDPNGDGKVIQSKLRGDDKDAMNGNAVMYDTGMILTLGGGPNYRSKGEPASANAYVIDINGGVGKVSVKRTGNMNSKRGMVNSVVLPSGEVAVFGGMVKSEIFSDVGAVYFAEIWNPKTGKFIKHKSMKVPRTYHSVAILMKDGRVFVAGGGLCGKCGVNHVDAEIFTPPYLLNPDGSAKTRPKIISYPHTANNGSIVSVTMDTSGSHSFALLRLGAVTHSVNNDVRRIPLSISSKSGSTFNLQVPHNPGIALPGMYFLFALNQYGVPCIAHTISVANK